MDQLTVRSARPIPLSDLLSLPSMVRSLWRYRDLIRQFTIREVMVRHKGTSLGILWAIVQPLLTLGIYTFIFGFVMPNRWEDFAGPAWLNFPLNFFTGYTIFAVFSDTVNRSPSLITEHPNLVRKVVFPLEILPLTTCGAGLVYFLFSVALILVVHLGFAGAMPWTVILFPITMVPLLMFALGVSWIFASLGAFIRDFKQVVPVLTQLLFFVTPTFYDVRGRNIAPLAKTLIELNPLTVIVQSGRQCLLWGETPDWARLGVVTALALAVMIFGYAWFTKSKRGLADVL